VLHTFLRGVERWRTIPQKAIVAELKGSRIAATMTTAVSARKAGATETRKETGAKAPGARGRSRAVELPAVVDGARREIRANCFLTFESGAAVEAAPFSIGGAKADCRKRLTRIPACPDGMISHSYLWLMSQRNDNAEIARYRRHSPRERVERAQPFSISNDRGRLPWHSKRFTTCGSTN
jgi:hypothetical protein